MNTLKKLLDSEAGIELKDFLTDECEKINDIRNVKEQSSPTAQAIEFKATKRAAQILNAILKKIINLDNFRGKVGKINYV